MTFESCLLWSQYNLSLRPTTFIRAVFNNWLTRVPENFTSSCQKLQHTLSRTLGALTPQFLLVRVF